MLYTKKGPIPPDQVSPWTCFFLNLREPIDIPTVKEFGRFLATSLGFTANLKKVEVFVDDDRILYFDKKIADPRPLEFVKGVYDLQSPNKTFTLEKVVIRSIQVSCLKGSFHTRETGVNRFPPAGRRSPSQIRQISTRPWRQINPHNFHAHRRRSPESESRSFRSQRNGTHDEEKSATYYGDADHVLEF